MVKKDLFRKFIICINTMLDNYNNYTAFQSSLDLDNHPILSARKITKDDYFTALYYFATKQSIDSFVLLRLDDYQRAFHISSTECDEYRTRKAISTVVDTRTKPWRNKYKLWLLCDLALILLNEELITKAEKEICSFTSQGQQKQLELLLHTLLENKAVNSSFKAATNLIKQYQDNRTYAFSKEKRYIVTANMSAGKSTFINAVIGKSLARTSEEACTGNITYFYSKPYDDGAVHFCGDTLTLHATQNELTSFSWDNKIYIASFFRLFELHRRKMCIIDTPGVNSAMNQNHSLITKDILQKGEYDKVLYILNASKLGTDEELAYIRWVSANVPHNKVIFILNKLDNFKKNEDSIEASIEGVRNDLIKFFENPVICPLSARFALLIKMKFFGEKLSPDEEDEYYYFAKKFKKPEFDLSGYYECNYPDGIEDECVLLSQKCGIYGLEKLLQGGNV